MAFLVLVSVTMAFPMYAEAGIFSNFTKTAEAETTIESRGEVLNSQKMSIIEPALGPSIKKSSAENKVAAVDVVINGGAIAPQIGPLGSALDIADLPETDQISIYTVRKGDTISGVAEMFGVSDATIRAANGLSLRESLREGQVLTILPFSGREHTIKKGDTITTIAKKYSVSKKDILAVNNMEAEDSLSIGDTLLVPDPDFTIEEPAPTKKPVSSGGTIKTPSVASKLDLGNYYLRPIAGGVVSQKAHGVGGRGADIAAPKGTPIMAAADGTVVLALYNDKYNLGYGNYVIISHPNGTQTLYAHMTEVKVSQGQQVSRGQVIGTVGRTGKATGMHLHFEVRGAKNPLAHSSSYGL